MAQNDRTTERNIEPTAQRISESRRRGSVARSAELTTHVTLLAALGSAALFGPRLGTQLVQMVRSLLDPAQALSSPSELADLLWFAVQPVLTTFLAAVMLVFLAAMIASFVQVGFLFASQRVNPDASRLNPVDGMLRIFSARSAWRLGLTLLKVALVGLFGGLMLQSHLDEIVQSAAGGPLDIVRTAWELALQLAIPLLAVLLVTGMLDYAFQRFQHRRDLRMTREEFLEEMKRNEGPGQRLRRADQTPLTEGGEHG